MGTRGGSAGGGGEPGGPEPPVTDADVAERAERLSRLPDPVVSGLWFGGAHLALATALAVVAWDPGLLAAAFYHPRLLTAVHLVTLGWISGSILGALYLVPPLALRVRLSRHRGDRWAAVVFAAGVAGVAAHFWRGEPLGVAWSALPPLAAAAWVAWRVLPALPRAPVPAAVRRAFPLAFVGFAAAAALGALVAVDRAMPFLPGSFFGKAFGHAHLAALGWALLIVLGSAYRLLPMLLPAAMPRGRGSAASVTLVATGAAGLALALPLASRAGAMTAAAAAIAGIALLLVEVFRMLRNPRPRPAARPRRDLPLGHVAAALASLVLAATLGGWIVALGPASPPGLRAAYGVLGLVGFFTQLVVGVEQRLVAWQVWLVSYAGGGFRRVPPTPYELVPRRSQGLILGLWLVGLPLLAAGAAGGWPTAVRAGASLLLLATVVSGLVLATLLRRVRRAGVSASPAAS